MPPALLSLGEFQAIPFLVTFFAAAAYQLSWSIYVSDYSRYLPANVGVTASFLWTYLGAFIGGVWMMLVGTFAAALYPHADVAGAMQQAADALVPGFGWFLLAGGLLGLVSISALNFYGASLTLLSVADCFRPQRASVRGRLVALSIAAVVSIWIALAASKDFVNRFADLLNVLLYLFTPWTAINLVDFYWVRKCHYSVREIFNPHGIYGRWSWRGLLAYGCGFAPWCRSSIPACTWVRWPGSGRRRSGHAGRAARFLHRLFAVLPLAGHRDRMGARPGARTRGSNSPICVAGPTQS